MHVTDFRGPRECNARGDMIGSSLSSLNCDTDALKRVSDFLLSACFPAAEHPAVGSFSATLGCIDGPEELRWGEGAGVEEG